MKATVDLADLVGLHLVMGRTAGKGEYKILVAAMGWATAELVMSRWERGARGGAAGRERGDPGPCPPQLFPRTSCISPPGASRSGWAPAASSLTGSTSR